MAALTISVASAVAGPRIQWPKYEWARCQQPFGNTLCATNDHGRHWHRILNIRDWNRGNEPSISTFIRWSGRAGVISLDDWGVSVGHHSELWTRDGGRHWYPASVLNAGYNPSCYEMDYSAHTCSTGVDFFPREGYAFALWTETVTPVGNGSQPPQVSQSAKLYRLDGWPPQGPAQCLRPIPDYGGPLWLHNVCNGRPIDAEMRAVPIA